MTSVLRRDGRGSGHMKTEVGTGGLLWSLWPPEAETGEEGLLPQSAAQLTPLGFGPSILQSYETTHLCGLEVPSLW